MVEYEVIRDDGDAVTLALRGSLAGDRQVHEFHDALRDHYVDDGVQRIRADLSGLDSISLEGVAVLILLLQESTRRGKRFEVVNPPGVVRQQLELTGILPFLAPNASDR